jgi:DNA-binding NarL/FixJ family response regulator
MSAPVTVLVVDDQQLIRESIAALMSIQDGLSVVGTAADGHEAVERAVELQPDVVLMDVRMPGMDGVEAAAMLRHRVPGSRVVMLTTFDDEEYVVRALRCGAVGYLLKDLPHSELARAIKLAHQGVAQFDPAAVVRLLAALDRGAGLAAGLGAGEEPAPVPDPGQVPLTGREVEVLRLVATGATNREIAASLYLSEGTVKNHISRILTRLDLRDRTQAALYAREHGVLR